MPSICPRKSVSTYSKGGGLPKGRQVGIQSNSVRRNLLRNKNFIYYVAGERVVYSGWASKKHWGTYQVRALRPTEVIWHRPHCLAASELKVRSLVPSTSIHYLPVMCTWPKKPSITSAAISRPRRHGSGWNADYWSRLMHLIFLPDKTSRSVMSPSRGCIQGETPAEG